MIKPVPPHVLPVMIGGFAVLEIKIVPLLVMVARVPVSVNVLISSVPPAVVIKVPFTTWFPRVVFVPLELINVKLL